jgi:6-phosphogluconolactonase (cycloisomerase 2 family)
MSAQLSFDPACTAVLCMDYQAGVVSVYARDEEGLLARAAGVLKGARDPFKRSLRRRSQS